MIKINTTDKYYYFYGFQNFSIANLSQKNKFVSEKYQQLVCLSVFYGNCKKRSFVRTSDFCRVLRAYEGSIMGHNWLKKEGGVTRG